MSTTSIIEQPEVANRGGKYLIFALGAEEYGLEILKVREIIGYMEITAVPHTPVYVRGVINLRGQVISVVDLRSRFWMPPSEMTEQTCIIVVEIKSDGRRVNMGIVVDKVCEVLSIPSTNIEDAPSFGDDIDNSFILGMGRVGVKVKILLDIDCVLSSQELGGLSTAAVAERSKQGISPKTT